jgi:antirestriction protein ArdC
MSRSTFDPSLNLDSTCLRGTFRRDRHGRFLPRGGGELEETLAQRLAHRWGLSPTDEVDGLRLDARPAAELRRMLRFASRSEWEGDQADRAERAVQRAEARHFRSRGAARSNPWTRTAPDGSLDVRFCRGHRGRFLPNPPVADALYPWEVPTRTNPPGFALQGRSEEVLNRILERFRDPASLPAPLAQVFVRNDASHASRLSLMNQFIIAMHGEWEAMGFQQWREHGRAVKKGGKGMAILAPLARSIEVENDQGQTERRTIIKGFKHVVVFGLSQTEGEPYDLHRDDGFLAALPFVDVARAWGLTVTAYTGGGKRLGYFSPDERTIALGVKNPATFAHELVHAADHRLGALNIEKYGKDKRAKADAEVVAELGGATLLAAVGQAEAADLGGAYEYLTSWSPDGDSRVAAFRVLDRVLKAVQLVISEAQRLAGVAPATGEGGDAPATGPGTAAAAVMPSPAPVSAPAPAPAVEPEPRRSAAAPEPAAVPAGGRQLTIWDNPGPRRFTRADVRHWWTIYGEAAARDLAAARSGAEIGGVRAHYRLTAIPAPSTAAERHNARVVDALWNDLNHRVHGSTIVHRYPWGDGDRPRSNPPAGAVVGLGRLVALVVRTPDGKRIRITPQDERWLAWRASTKDLLVLRPATGPEAAVDPDAARRHRRFHGAAPAGARPMIEPPRGRGLRTLGFLESVTYCADGIQSPSKKGHLWIHHFGDRGERGHGPTRANAVSPYRLDVMPRLLVGQSGDLVIQRRAKNDFAVKDWIIA